MRFLVDECTGSKVAKWLRAVKSDGKSKNFTARSSN